MCNKFFSIKKIVLLFYLSIVFFLVVSCSSGIEFTTLTSEEDFSEVGDQLNKSQITAKKTKSSSQKSSGDSSGSSDEEGSSDGEGSSDETKTENFTVTMNHQRLEILIVVDASGSMNEELKTLAQNMEPLLTFLGEKDWHMAFTLAQYYHPVYGPSGQCNIPELHYTNRYGPCDGGLFMKLEKKGALLNQYILDKTTVDFKQIFKDMLSVNFKQNLPPYQSSGYETPMKALQMAIERASVENTPNKSFFKANSDTVVIIITDTDEGGSLGVTYGATAKNVIDAFNTAFSGQNKNLYGFVISDPNRDTNVRKLATLTEGKHFSVHSSNYKANLTDISKIASLLVNSFTLQKTPVSVSKVNIFMSPHQEDVTWVLDGRELKFSGDIEEGTQITVTYTYKD